MSCNGILLQHKYLQPHSAIRPSGYAVSGDLMKVARRMLHDICGLMADQMTLRTGPFCQSKFHSHFELPDK